MNYLSPKALEIEPYTPGEQPREKSPRRIPMGLLIAAAAAVAGIAAVLIWLISGGRL